ncbi:hypothetical protein, partial [Methylobacterium oxalidis]|uniref:hypothetical protein n=1 Tax=Methylobacterium oxalidis TaxID=944322 RepID=UPI0033157E86
EREASPLAGFCAARISTTPTLQWMVLSPPYTGGALGISGCAKADKPIRLKLAARPRATVRTMGSIRVRLEPMAREIDHRIPPSS